MRRIVVVFPKIVFAIVLVAMAMVARVDGVRAATGILVYALSSPSATIDYGFGESVVTGDVNGDGRADVIVGAPYENHAHVFSGADGALLYSLSMPTPVSGAGFGASIAAGDANGDGMADIIVAAPSETVGPNSEQGRVYVFSGANAAMLYALDTPNPEPSGLFGSAVAAGDVNGDARVDIIVAAPAESVASADRGRVYVFSGADRAPLYAHVSPYAVDFGQFGTAVATGDVNGDGLADIVVGEWLGGFAAGNPWTHSVAHIFSGVDGSLLRTLGRSGYYRFDGEFGSALALGDANADGEADVFVGDPTIATTFVFDGAGGSLLYTLRNPIPVPGAWPTFGAAVAAGDVDGDGRADAVVGMLPDGSSIPSLGRTYVFSGADGSLLDTLDSPNPGVQWGDSFGSAVAAEDVDGDGRADMIVGAPGWPYDGQVYVFSHEADGDGCADAKEPLLVPPTDPRNSWDFFSVPVPALISAPYPTTVFRDGTVSALDAESVWAYFLAGAKSGAPVYEQDLNRNGVRDGLEYDRSVAGPAHGGPPDGAVTAQDAQLALAQFRMGYDCLNAP